MNVGEILENLGNSTGFAGFGGDGWKALIMIFIALFFLWLGIKKKFEPLLLVGIAFGMLLTNLPEGGLYHPEMLEGKTTIDYLDVLQHGGLLDILYIGVKTGVYPCLIFIGVGAMTDFGPMLSRPSSMMLGAAAQGGIYLVFILAVATGAFTGGEAGSISIIAGADGPTAIFLTKTLAPELLAPIAVAAYSYMALIPLLQPPFMKLLTTKKERMTVMTTTRKVSKREKIIFPILVTIIVSLLLPSVAPLLGSLMFGNLLKECGVTERLSDTAQNALMNIVTLFLGISVGATAIGATFLTTKTLLIVVLGLCGFVLATICGLLIGKLMFVISKGKINPLIGSAGVSAVPMAARVSNTVGLQYNKSNYLLMHAMGPNVAGVIGSAVAAGFLLAVFG